MKFLTGEPALLAGDSLVVADLHIGIEKEFRQAGLYLPSQLEKMVARLDRLLKVTKAKRLVIMGDVKHQVPGTSWQELREVPGFFRHFSKKVGVEVVPGNHDAPLFRASASAKSGGAETTCKSLEELLPGVKVHPSSGMLVGDFWLAHGHAWPGKGFLKAKYLVISHSHPQVEFKDKLGYRWLEPVWMRTGLERKRVEAKYKKVEKLPELVLMPAFNPFAGGIALNREMEREELLGPVIKCARLASARLYLLDGTLLGKLPELKSNR